MESALIYLSSLVPVCFFCVRFSFFLSQTHTHTHTHPNININKMHFLCTNIYLSIYVMLFFCWLCKFFVSLFPVQVCSCGKNVTRGTVFRGKVRGLLYAYYWRFSPEIVSYTGRSAPIGYFRYIRQPSVSCDETTIIFNRYVIYFILQMEWLEGRTARVLCHFNCKNAFPKNFLIVLMTFWRSLRLLGNRSQMELW